MSIAPADAEKGKELMLEVQQQFYELSKHESKVQKWLKENNKWPGPYTKENDVMSTIRNQVVGYALFAGFVHFTAWRVLLPKFKTFAYVSTPFVIFTLGTMVLKDEVQKKHASFFESDRSFSAETFCPILPKLFQAMKLQSLDFDEEVHIDRCRKYYSQRVNMAEYYAYLRGQGEDADLEERTNAWLKTFPVTKTPMQETSTHFGDADSSGDDYNKLDREVDVNMRDRDDAVDMDMYSSNTENGAGSGWENEQAGREMDGNPRRYQGDDAEEDDRSQVGHARTSNGRHASHGRDAYRERSRRERSRSQRSGGGDDEFEDDFDISNSGRGGGVDFDIGNIGGSKNGDEYGQGRDRARNEW